MDYINNVTVFSLEMATVRDPIFSPFPDVYFPNGESPKNVSEVTFPVFRSRTLMVVTSPRWLIGDVGVGVSQNATKAGISCYSGKPTFRTKSENRGSARIGSSKKSVFKLIRLKSRS